MNAMTLKVAAAGLGTAAILTMGALSAAVSGPALADPAEPGPIETPEATLGETITVASAAPKRPATLRATPGITGPAPLPEEEQGLPGD